MTVAKKRQYREKYRKARIHLFIYSAGNKYTLRKGRFVLFLLSQAFSGLGDTFKFIAITSLLVNITGSGLSAGLSLAFSIVPGILFSLFAGAIGDLLPAKFLLVVIELIRSIIGLLFINNRNLAHVYILITLLSSLDAFYNPPLRKTLVNLSSEKNNQSGEKDVLPGNSLLSGTFAVTSILGSLGAGIVVSKWSVRIALLLNCYFHLVAAVLLIFLRTAHKECIYK
ncbi:MAG TPA: hypothetical protein PK733_13670, partial [Clostridiales bacterium]|nr:hypothetical protein [Clostridiales bacterium]